jgi:hypothetical protein
MRRTLLPLSLLAVTALASPVFADNAPPLGSLAKMPITEVTVFKDGSAFVLHAGKMPTDPAGNVLLDYLPSPVMGTFWPASADPKVKLNGVTASQRRVMVERTALSIRELLEANPGAGVQIKETPDNTTVAGAEYSATIIGLPQRSVTELEATSPPNSAPKLPEKGNLVLLKTATGTKALDINRIQNVTFTNPPKAAAGNEELRHLLTLKLQWPDKPQPQADISMMYLQKGIRWIPNYKVTIDGSGNAVLQLHATLINELYDLNDVTTHLVIGVPTFAFGDLLDPIGLQQAVAQLSNVFRNDRNSNGQMLNNFNNSMMTQVAVQQISPNRGEPGGGGGGGDLGPDLGSQKNEDLFIFTVNHISLKKGDRMVVPINEFKLTYKDVYVLDIPFTPPPEMWRNLDSNRQAELARLYASPKAMHVLRFNNTAAFPITTAPALVFKGDKVIAQTMAYYTPNGGQLDLSLTPAIDITVKKTDREVKRNPNAEMWNGNPITRIELAGTIALANLGTTKADLEIRRSVLGAADKADKADNDAKIEMLNPFEDRSFLPAGADSSQPFWWSWYNWPEWSSRFNGVGSISWKTSLDPGKNVTLTYSWHYYWR